VGFPRRLVAEKVTSTVCLWKIYLTCPLKGQAALISTESIHFSVKLRAALPGASSTRRSAHEMRAANPKASLRLRTGVWWGSVTPAAFCSQETEGFVLLFVLCLQRPCRLRCIESAGALPVCFGRM